MELYKYVWEEINAILYGVKRLNVSTNYTQCIIIKLINFECILIVEVESKLDC